MADPLHPDPRSPAGPHVLDDPAWSALTGPHAHLAQVVGRAHRYPPEVCSFAALADPDDPRAWADLRELTGPGGSATTTRSATSVARGWQTLVEGEGVQVVAAPTSVPAGDPEAVVLAAADAPEVLDLVARTRPGPFEPRTLELGTYPGLRRSGRLVAMAGERVRPAGWTEISAVCTDPASRGRGLAGRLVREVAVGDTGALRRPAGTTSSASGGLRLTPAGQAAIADRLVPRLLPLLPPSPVLPVPAAAPTAPAASGP